MQACDILGALPRDPGGKWSNRPIITLTTLFLPWFPNYGFKGKRFAAMKFLCKEWPTVVWEVLISLLPDNADHLLEPINLNGYLKYLKQMRLITGKSIGNKSQIMLL